MEWETCSTQMLVVLPLGLKHFKPFEFFLALEWCLKETTESFLLQVIEKPEKSVLASRLEH